MYKHEQVLNVWQRVGIRVGLTKHRASATALTPSTHWSRPQPGFPRGFLWTHFLSHLQLETGLFQSLAKNTPQNSAKFLSVVLSKN